MPSLKHILIRLLPAPARVWLRHRRALGQIASYREQDWEWSAVARRLIRPGTTVIDAGANIGYLARLFARWVGPEGRVVAVEPIPETFAILRDAHEGNPGWRHVFLLNAALSDEPGRAVMVIPRQAHGVANFYEASLSAPGGEGESVQVEKRTVDELCRHLELEPGFIKIDVEGHELEVIRGAGHTLRAHRPALLIEVKGSPDTEGSASAGLFHLLRGHGYAPHVLDAGVLRPHRPGDRFVDVLFLQPDQAVACGLAGKPGA